MANNIFLGDFMMFHIFFGDTNEFNMISKNTPFFGTIVSICLTEQHQM